ncbi:MAG: DUF6364 family protein [Parafilimonas sp.]
MTVKLNLTIDEKIAKRIKSYASKKKTSVSKIAQEQFDKILTTEKPDTSFRDFIDKYAGSIKSKKPIDVKKDKAEYLRKKYGV